LRKLLLIIVLIPLLGAGAWWYFREQVLPDYGPAYREYAYVTNGKSNTVSVIDLRTFELAKTIPVGAGPTGVAANSKKNEIYVVNAGSNNVSVIDAEKNAVVQPLAFTGNLSLLMFPKTASGRTWQTRLPPMFRLSMSRSGL